MDLSGQTRILKMVEEKDYNGLRVLLEQSNPVISLQAAQALAELGDGSGWRYLEDALRNPGDLNLRTAAALLLGELGDQRAIPVLRDTLIKLTSPASGKLANTICLALESIGTPEAEEALREAGYQPVLPEQHHTVIEYDNRYVKAVSPQATELRFLSAETHLNNAVELREAELAERGLVECNIALWMKPDWSYAWYVRGVLLEDLGRPLEALLAYRRAYQLDPSHTETRDTLAEIEEQVVFDEKEPADLLNDLANGSWQERRDAAALLSNTNDSGMTGGLVLALQDSEREVRHAALEALSRNAYRLQDPEAVVTAVLEMQESSWLLRFTRLYALSQMRTVEGLVAALAGEMERIHRENLIFRAQKDPLLEVEYELLQEVGILALEDTEDVESLLVITEENAWEEVDEEEDASLYDEETLEKLEEDEDWIDEDLMAEMEEAAAEAEESLNSYVDETAELVAAALDRLAKRKMTELPAEIVQRLSEVPDLSLLDITVEDPSAQDLVTIYDLTALRAAATAELSRRGG